MKLWTAFFMVIWCILALIAASYIVGCSVSHPTPGSGGSPSHGPGTTPSVLSGLAGWLEVFAIVAVPLAVAGVVLYFLEPAAHKLSLFLAVTGASLFGVSVSLRVSLWLVPWLAGGLIVSALAVLAYEVYRKFDKHNQLVASWLSTSKSS